MGLHLEYKTFKCVGTGSVAIRMIIDNNQRHIQSQVRVACIYRKPQFPYFLGRHVLPADCFGELKCILISNYTCNKQRFVYLLQLQLIFSLSH